MSEMSSTDGGRKRLGGGWITFIVIDVILVIAVLVVAVIVFAGGNGKNDPSVATGPTSSQAPSESAEDPGADAPSDSPEPEESESTDDADEQAKVASPSGNIVCTISEDGATCSISDLEKKPKKDKSCDGTVGHVYTVTEDGVDAPCVPKGKEPGNAGDGVEKLEYGKTANAYGFTCTSDETGMGCKSDKSGQGFTLARAGAETF